MKVLWIVNITMPDSCQALNLPVPVIGGWLCGYRDALLSAYPNIELHIIEPYSGASTKEIQTTDDSSKKIYHHLFPASWISSSNSFAQTKRSSLAPLSNQLPAYFIQLNQTIQPDVIHLHGSEFPQQRIWVESCGIEHTLVSIQGLTSVYARYALGGLTDEDLKGTWSFNDWKQNKSLYKEQQKLAQRGNDEKRLLGLVEHIAGRTSWDRAHAWAIHPTAQYHTLQEILRKEFYAESGSWKIENCQRHSIFVSQSHYPIKGIHKLLEAMPIVLKHYPDTQLYIVGEDPLPRHWRHRTTYQNVLRRLILGNHTSTKSYGSMAEHIHYLGLLSADQMIANYQSANVFICPSAIENSCNSVCEAQMIGTPVIATYCGGLMDLIKQYETGLLYRFEEIEMLARQICELFADDTLAQKLSQHATQAAQQRHDPMAIAQELYTIYKQV